MQRILRGGGTGNPPAALGVIYAMETLPLNLLNGISFAMILFLMASGFTLIFGAMGILNMSHGAIYILGGYVGLTVVSHGGNFLLAVLVAAICAGFFGLILEKVFLSRLHGLLNEQVLLTLGIVYILENLFLWIWGPTAKIGTTPDIVSGSVNVGGFIFPMYRLVLIGIGAAVAIGLWWFYEKTRAGAIVRAGIDDKETTVALGINYPLVSTLVFSLGASLCGFAGFVGAPVIAIYYAKSFQVLLLAVIVVVVGGVGSMSGALLGAILIGLIDSLGRAYFPDFTYFIIYLAMIVTLLVKPAGLLGRER